MYHNNDWGMHMMWIFWLPILILIIVFIVRIIGNNDAFRRLKEKESPLDILKKRYANGEISTEEFEERRNKLKS